MIREITYQAFHWLGQLADERGNCDDLVLFGKCGVLKRIYQFDDIFCSKWFSQIFLRLE